MRLRDEAGDRLHIRGETREMLGSLRKKNGRVATLATAVEEWTHDWYGLEASRDGWPRDGMRARTKV